jgi:DNA-binding transcriptional MerR regulator
MRSYDLSELEEMSALSRRTISDYVSRGLLAGPSHRGRGARYSQRDLDALRVIPRLRTIMKLEFPSLISVRNFLTEVTASELRRLVRLTNERAFEVEVRRIRLCKQLKTFLPAVSPEKLTAAMSRLTPEQVCGVDRGQIQIGTLLNVEALTAEEGANGYSNTHIKEVELNGNGDADQRYERFGNATVQVSIEKQALENQTSGISLTDTIHDFAEQLETLLKASS